MRNVAGAIVLEELFHYIVDKPARGDAEALRVAVQRECSRIPSLTVWAIFLAAIDKVRHKSLERFLAMVLAAQDVPAPDICGEFRRLLAVAVRRKHVDVAHRGQAETCADCAAKMKRMKLSVAGAQRLAWDGRRLALTILFDALYE
jgi:hypothetical protein